MPELPEVETTVRALTPLVTNKVINQVQINNYQLRIKIPATLASTLVHKKIINITRRAKYILLHLEQGFLLVHLGMSGTLKYLANTTPLAKHDHVILNFCDDFSLRFNDPRRFGLFTLSHDSPQQHRLLAQLGLEPFDRNFSAQYLFNATRNKKISIKQLIMEPKIVVGVGNIYATEALFLAQIHPQRSCNTLSLAEYKKLVTTILQVLRAGIKAGGTTLKDFNDPNGKAGYFQQQLKVYGRAQQPCINCSTPLSKIIQAQRSTVFCAQCQH